MLMPDRIPFSPLPTGTFPQIRQFRSVVCPPLLTTGQAWNGGADSVLLAKVQLTAITLPLFTLIAPLFPTNRQFARTGVAGVPWEPPTKIPLPPSPGAWLLTKSQETIALGELPM